MAIYFAPIARLLGDLVVCLQPLQQLIESGEEVRLVVRSESQIGLAECVHGLAGYIKESEFLERLSTNESLDAFRRLLEPQLLIANTNGFAWTIQQGGSINLVEIGRGLHVTRSL